jgi:hypothetical protein
MASKELKLAKDSSTLPWLVTDGDGHDRADTIPKTIQQASRRIKPATGQTH